MEEKFDKELRIRTQGIREWREHTLYNRCESTPYKALETLFKRYHLETGDQMVDFGAGRGRVAFYVHNKFNIPITGVELHETTLDEALNNKISYRTIARDLDSPIKFEYGYAENYEIDKDDNKFYFFNPFQAPVFEEVVENIIKSAEEDEKEVDIILYYPMPGYKKYLNEETDFTLIDKVLIDGAKDKREKFLIYRYDPNKEKPKKEEKPKFPLKLKRKRK